MPSEQPRRPDELLQEARRKTHAQKLLRDKARLLADERERHRAAVTRYCAAVDEDADEVFLASLRRRADVVDAKLTEVQRQLSLLALTRDEARVLLGHCARVRVRAERRQERQVLRGRCERQGAAHVAYSATALRARWPQRYADESRCIAEEARNSEALSAVRAAVGTQRDAVDRRRLARKRGRVSGAGSVDEGKDEAEALRILAGLQAEHVRLMAEAAVLARGDRSLHRARAARRHDEHGACGLPRPTSAAWQQRITDSQLQEKRHLRSGAFKRNLREQLLMRVPPERAMDNEGPPDASGLIHRLRALLSLCTLTAQESRKLFLRDPSCSAGRWNDDTFDAACAQLRRYADGDVKPEHLKTYSKLQKATARRPLREEAMTNQVRAVASRAQEVPAAARWHSEGEGGGGGGCSSSDDGPVPSATDRGSYRDRRAYLRQKRRINAYYSSGPAALQSSDSHSPPPPLARQGILHAPSSTRDVPPAPPRQRLPSSATRDHRRRRRRRRRRKKPPDSACASAAETDRPTGLTVFSLRYTSANGALVAFTATSESCCVSVASGCGSAEDASQPARAAPARDVVLRRARYDADVGIECNSGELTIPLPLNDPANPGVDAQKLGKLATLFDVGSVLHNLHGVRRVSSSPAHAAWRSKFPLPGSGSARRRWARAAQSCAPADLGGGDGVGRAATARRKVESAGCGGVQISPFEAQQRVLAERLSVLHEKLVVMRVRNSRRGHGDGLRSSGSTAPARGAQALGGAPTTHSTHGGSPHSACLSLQPLPPVASLARATYSRPPLCNAQGHTAD